MHSITINKKTWTTLLWSITISYFTILMINITLPYTSWEWDVDFLQTKFYVVHKLYYRIAFYTHIFTSSIVIGTGIFLFSPIVLKRWPSLHRIMGKAYVALVLILSAPTGLVMAFHANGTWLAKVSFTLLAIIWWWTTYMGYTTIRNKQIAAHRKWMIRSYALTLSAITLRLSQMLLAYYCDIDPEMQYTVVSWTSWVFNLIIAEFLCE